MSLPVSILLFNEVEVLDFAGPFEVFSLAEDSFGRKLFTVRTVAQHAGPISARNGLRVIPDSVLDNGVSPTILVVPGGWGAETVERYNPVLTDYVRLLHKNGVVIASVCTGAFILAAAGILDGHRAVTHHLDRRTLAADFPSVSVFDDDTRLADEGRVLTCGGIAAGIDMSLYLVSRFFGADAARACMVRMEYRSDVLDSLIG